MKALFAAATAVAAASVLLVCAPASDADPLEENFSLQFREVVTFGDPPFSIEFASLVDDSRCPRSVICVWEGVAEVEVRLTTPEGTTEVFSLFTFSSLAGEFPPVRTVAGLEIELVALDPYPADPGPDDPNDYTLTLAVRSLAAVPVDGAGWSALKSRWGQ